MSVLSLLKISAAQLLLDVNHGQETSVQESPCRSMVDARKLRQASPEAARSARDGTVLLGLSVRALQPPVKPVVAPPFRGASCVALRTAGCLA